MKKRMPVMFALLLLAVRGWADKGDFIGNATFLSVFYSPTLFTDDSIYNDVSGQMFGLGIRELLEFDDGEPKNRIASSAFMIAPALSLESDFASLLRLRGGVHIGKWAVALIFHTNYYIGASGIFLRDFTNNVSAAGIAPEIGIEFGIALFTLRWQAQYEWYTDKRYNGFVGTFAIGIWLAELW